MKRRGSVRGNEALLSDMGKSTYSLLSFLVEILAEPQLSDVEVEPDALKAAVFFECDAAKAEHLERQLVDERARDRRYLTVLLLEEVLRARIVREARGDLISARGTERIDDDVVEVLAGLSAWIFGCKQLDESTAIHSLELAESGDARFSELAELPPASQLARERCEAAEMKKKVQRSRVEREGERRRVSDPYGLEHFENAQKASADERRGEEER